MSVVRINAISIPGGAGPELEKRFAARAGAVDGQPGFESFELLRPTDGGDKYFVVTRWADAASFDAWMSSQSFAAGHAGPPSSGAAGDAGGAEAPRPPVSTGAELLSFDVVDLS